MTSPSDTRPIAKLPECSKILERIVYNQLLSYLERNHLLNSRQAGFRKGHSTQTALLGVLEDVRIAIDERKLTFLVMFDFSKAFDTIPHKLLLLKLRNLNFSDSSLRWFFSYLCDRLQAVCENGESISEWVKTFGGVPQGSVLGPLLFSIFINDLPEVLLHSKYIIFADDTQIYYSFYPTDFSAALDIIQNDAVAVANWASANGLTLNLNKTKAMILGSLAYTSALNLALSPKISILGYDIPYVSETLNLGIWITPTLNWEKHVSFIVQRVHKALRSLKFHKHALSHELRKSLVQSLILPYFDYCSAVYHDLDDTQNLRLHRALNACVRFIYGTIRYCDFVTPYRLELGWLSVRRRRELLIGTLAFNIIAYESPEYLADKFTRNLGTLRRSSRRPPEKLLFPTPRTAALQNSFHISASYLINSLPSIDFISRNFHSFKCHLFQHLLNSDKADWRERALLSSRL